MSAITERALMATAVLLVDGEAHSTLALYREQDDTITWYARMAAIPCLVCREGTRTVDSAYHQIRAWARQLGGNITRATVELCVVQERYGTEVFEPRSEWERSRHVTAKICKGGKQ